LLFNSTAHPVELVLTGTGRVRPFGTAPTLLALTLFYSEKMTMSTLLKTINQKIISISRSSQNIKELSGQVALLCWQHGKATGDCQPMARLLNAIKERPALAKAIGSFFRDFTPVTLFTRESIIKAGKLDPERQWKEPGEIKPEEYAHPETEREKEKKQERATKRTQKKEQEAQRQADLLKELDAAKTEADKAGDLKNENKRLKAEVKTLKQQVSNLQAEIEALKAVKLAA
jgi:hypothetical protein